jgi:hypothetical protein
LGHDLEHHSAKAATCTEAGWDAYDTCKRDGCTYTTYAEIAALGHDLEHHSAKAATCTEAGWDAYDTCKRDGCTYTTYAEIAALGHSYRVSVTAPTCAQKGYKTHVCSDCGKTYKSNYTKALSHWYGPWKSNGDGTHSAHCLRSKCNHSGTANCAHYEVIIDGNVLTCCPVCGALDDQQMLAVASAEVTPIDQNAIPTRGELVVSGLEAPFDGAIYALTAAYEFAGRIEPFRGTVRIAVPLERTTAFKLIRVDAMEAAETMEHTEVWTEILYTHEDGILAFETNSAGLFLLLSK